MRAPLVRIVLAEEADFILGELAVSPSKRQVFAGKVRERLQPRVMQVLVVLARRRGEVVSRDELIQACWNGFAVSDDAVQRCIARIRRVGEAHGGFRLETVPRVGYQLTEENRPMLWRSRNRLKLAITLAAAMVLLAAAGVVGAHLL
jgi:DNA-binding winged helix-turn-helix (wHTH) protein